MFQKGVSLDSKGYRMYTPLHYAADLGYFEIVKFLIENGANLNSMDMDRNTSLHLATITSKFNIEVIKVLLDHGADFKLNDNSGRSVLDLCKENQNGKVVIELILAKMISRSELQETLEPVQFTLDECVICDGRRQEIFSLYPCGHAKTCEMCCVKLIFSPDINSVCPICRCSIIGYNKVYV